MEELLCSIEIVKENNVYMAKIQSEYGGSREYSSTSIEDVVEQFVMDIQEEFESL